MYKLLLFVLFIWVNGVIGLAEAAGTVFYGKLGNSLAATDVLWVSCSQTGGYLLQAKITDIAPVSPPLLELRVFTIPNANVGPGLPSNSIMPTALAAQEGSSPVIIKTYSRYAPYQYWIFINKSASGSENYRVDLAFQGDNGQTFPVNLQPIYLQNQ